MPDTAIGDYAETLRRREAIACRDNPFGDRDYVVALPFVLPPAQPGEGAGEGRILMVPDRLIVGPEGLERYLAALAAARFDSPEARAGSMFDDLNNQLIPRWLWLRLEEGGRGVILQERQPNWRNDDLLTGLFAGGAGLPAE